MLPANYTFTGADNGSHTFTNATTLKTAGAAKTVVATDTVTATITGTTNLTVNPAAANAAASTLTATPSSIVADGATTSTLTATITDAYDNPLSGKTVTLAKSSGNSTITTITGTTNASGQATFTVKDTTAETTTYTATDTTDTLTVTQTATVTFTSGTVSATQSTVSASPGVGDRRRHRRTLDDHGHGEGHVRQPGRGQVGLARPGGRQLDDHDCLRHDERLRRRDLHRQELPRRARHVHGDRPAPRDLLQTATVDFTDGSATAAQSTVSAAPASVVADGSTTSTITVTLKDSHSTGVAGKTVTLAKSGGSSTITTVSGVTNGSGVATFTVKDTVAEATTYTATDTTDSVTVTQTATVTFTAGRAERRAVDGRAAPASVTADGSRPRRSP